MIWFVLALFGGFLTALYTLSAQEAKLEGKSTTAWRVLLVLPIALALPLLMGIPFPSGKMLQPFLTSMAIISVMALFIDVRLVETAARFKGVALSSMVSMVPALTFIMWLPIDWLFYKGESIPQNPWIFVGIIACIALISLGLLLMNTEFAGKALLRFFLPVVFTMAALQPVTKIVFNEGNSLEVLFWYPVGLLALELVWLNLYELFKHGTVNNLWQLKTAANSPAKLINWKWLFAMVILWLAITYAKNLGIDKSINPAYVMALMMGTNHIWVVFINWIFTRKASISQITAWLIVVSSIGLILLTQ